jgi:DNA-binding transcriptional MerR regulator
MWGDYMFYSISEFAKRIGVSTYTLRLWEKNGKLKPHHRTQGNQRVYTDEQVNEYLGLTKNKEVTFTFGGGKLIKEPISDLTDEEIEQVIKVAEEIKSKRSK